MSEQAWLRARGTLVVAHRGACASAPENTMAAFRLAAEQGADGVEFDVRSTADGHLVVIHDGSLERTTDGRGEVAGLTLEEIRHADAGVRRAAAFAGERVPTLAEVLAFSRGRLLVDVELKVTGLEGQVAEAVARAEMTDHTLLTSFLEDALVAARAAAPGIVLGLLQQWADPARAVDRGVEVYLPNVRALSAQTVAFCRTHHLRIIPWTVRSEEDARAALGYEVDGLIADDPLLARRAMEGVR